MELLATWPSYSAFKNFAMYCMFVRGLFTAYHCRIGLFYVSGDNIGFESHSRQSAVLLLL
jgi:hypothetical protein